MNDEPITEENIVHGLVVDSRFVLDGDKDDPPTVEMRLEDGSFVKVGYDLDARLPVIWVANSREAEFVISTKDGACMVPGVLECICDEVEQMAISFESNRRAEYLNDAMSYSDGRTP